MNNIKTTFAFVFAVLGLDFKFPTFLNQTTQSVPYFRVNRSEFSLNLLFASDPRSSQVCLGVFRCVYRYTVTHSNSFGLAVDLQGTEAFWEIELLEVDGR